MRQRNQVPGHKNTFIRIYTQGTKTLNVGRRRESAARLPSLSSILSQPPGPDSQGFTEKGEGRDEEETKSSNLYPLLPFLTPKPPPPSSFSLLNPTTSVAATLQFRTNIYLFFSFQLPWTEKRKRSRVWHFYTALLGLHLRM